MPSARVDLGPDEMEGAWLSGFSVLNPPEGLLPSPPVPASPPANAPAAAAVAFSAGEVWERTDAASGSISCHTSLPRRPPPATCHLPGEL